MILTLTLNPAVDVSLTTDRIAYDDRTYIDGESFEPGGKGINQAITLHGYGAEVHAVAPFGGAMGERFANLLRARGVEATLIPVRGETRRNLAISDATGLTLKLDQRGPELTSAEIEKVREAVCNRLKSADWLTLMGAAPAGVPDDFYPRLIRSAQKAGVQTLVDTSGDALRPALEAGPTLAKPNRPEAERLLDRSLLTERDFVQAAHEIRGLGPLNVILSLGGQGAVAATSEGVFRATTHPAEGGSPIGAGDVLGATTIWALLDGQPFPDAFRFGVAAATVAAGRPGLGSGSLDDVRATAPEVDVRRIDPVT